MRSPQLASLTDAELADELVLRGVALNDVEKLVCRSALQAQGTIKAAAEKLGVDRHALTRRIAKHGIRKDWKAG